MIRDLIKTFHNFSPKERLVFFSALSVFIVALFITIGGLIYNNTVIQPAEGGSYTEGIVGQPTAINPVLAGANDADQDLIRLLYTDLLTLTANYATSSNGSVWTITLKDGLLWSDGEPITTADVVFTVQTIQNPETKSPQQNNWQGVEAIRLSNKEVQFNLKTPYAHFLENLKNLRIIPSHIFSIIPPSNLRLSTYNLEPIASGPYQFVSYQKEKTGFIANYNLEINPHYTGPSALIERLILKFFPTYNDAILAFNQKSIDGLGGIDALDLDKLKINHSTYAINIPRYYAVFFNPTVNPILKETVLRQALTLATDKAKILKEVLSNKGTTIGGPIPPYLQGYNKEAYQDDHTSLKEAAALLEANGWIIDQNSENTFRTKTIQKEIVPLKFSLIVPDISFLVEAANIIQQDWQNIGIDLSLIVAPVDEIQANYVRSRNYEMLLFGNILRTNTDLYSFFHSSQRFQPGLNLSLYNNSKVDTLLENLRQEFDPELQLTSITKIQQIIHDDYPAAFLFSPDYLYAAPQSLGGINQTFITGSSDRFDNINEWFLKTTRVFK
ncbi:MAG: hypothetical protein COU10_03470 [Candidatus Harrisonbacteria bacterium CG10_big_fil_rev_8_21_14_0_10_45_28]|uniref:Solute-binding protein family 5 domain-containing protein n=1 Tax=Candidatus Harrisonbacteria bacterium CG10_big_fil_rev_8_21_14_0_10_45_28 TaxID=1974586 RepID=A0A2H0UMP3_9BACT|nr:MAG: hypothetical protein COU10_03470 [Candidatus Harrisonbacteria bacterium CG10_big_fil_rev_8_21_14_0_10_45_28]